MVDFSLTTTDNGRQVDSRSTIDILDYSEHLDKYGIEGSKITSLKFKVKASRDANVYLSSSPSMDSAMPFYDVNFGAHINTKTLLIRRKDNLLTTPFRKSWDTLIDRHCLNSSEFRDFWVSWDKGIVKHGRGTVIGDDLIGKWIDPNAFPVRSIGVLNSYDSEGDWIIHATVYGNATNHFLNCSPPNEKADLYIYKPVVMLSVSMCAIECKTDEQCMGFNYKDNNCELLSFGVGVVTAIPKISETGWRFFTKCYVQQNACLDCLL
ncbi:unnamed protein product [Mytilus edulis]|uniref:Farnesoic acid O-methyl transferase domain-containing protein n=1 Tax=Mytilus edulis TaxID=6550 RepID=A0A8S3SZ55_MYTED|nr:unnamed protein product [Mytilus edulis]